MSLIFMTQIPLNIFFKDSVTISLKQFYDLNNLNELELEPAF